MGDWLRCWARDWYVPDTFTLMPVVTDQSSSRRCIRPNLVEMDFLH